jgi:hypothetical protein
MGNSEILSDMDKGVAETLARRNDRFYYYSSIPWSTDNSGLPKSRYTMLVDLLGVDIRISYTQAVYIATMQEALDFENLFGRVSRPCDCKKGEVFFSGPGLLYGECSNGLSSAEIFDQFDRGYESRFNRGKGSRPKYYPDVPDDLLIDIEWGNVDRGHPGYHYGTAPQLWGFSLNGQPALRVWHVNPFVLETTMLVLAEEPDWKKRFEFYREHRRSKNGVEVMRREFGLPLNHVEEARSR